MLKARVEDDPPSCDQHLVYSMMASRSSVLSSTENVLFELMFGREMQIPLVVKMGRAEVGTTRRL